MDWQQEKIFCLKRFRKWAEENYPGYHFTEYRKVFSYYITTLSPVELMQEWRVGANFKRVEIHKLWRDYEKQYGEIWYPK